MSLSRRRLTEQVIEYLRQEITNQTYPVGSRLPPEPQLMAQFGVGRSTVREAIRALAHEGLLEVRQGDGTYVRAIAAAEPLAARLRQARVNDVHEVRRALELEVVALAAERRRDEDLVEIRHWLAARSTALANGDAGAALDADIELHCAIARATHNAMLSDLYRVFAVTLRDALGVLWDAATPSVDDRSHADLVAAIEAGNAAQAVAVTRQILARHEATISRNIGPKQD
ncbi:FadR/GntR family transcriptional regulator [Chloroflexus sp.]|uniref:FadR/GntR family transcriptional regulator n=1 Tax=Chloroflexus sp. TaxID=1904827 RepID=UPI002611F0DB|nr:FadR/GntR family transcriptional regulator [uncultured Chloroflexus sp.]